jgi:spore germination cell wall hydrolase CwlJ-like protein
LSEKNDIVSYRLPPARSTRRHMWLLPVFFGLCLLPAYQSNWHSAASAGEKASPTQIVVDALRLAVVSPAAAAVNAAVQVQEASAAVKGGFPAQLEFLGPAGDRDRAINCLAVAAWYEAGNDFDGQRSVMQVVLNRVAHPNFPKSVCGVVFEGSQRNTGCQFTFTCDGSMARRRPSPAALARARAIATLALKSTIYPEVSQATHYHADYVLPWWSSKLVRLGKVGPHIFYRWPGTRGALSGRPSSASEAELAQLTFQAVSRAGNLAASSIAEGSQLAAATAMTGPLSQSETAEGNIAVVSPALKTDSAIFFAVDGASPSGRWAVSALGKCVGQTGCRVLAYENQERLAHNSTTSARAREKPIFLFVRDAASGVELALWDCEKVERPNASQCLPNADRELARLLRDRNS